MPKKETEAKTSVKSYQQGVTTEKQKMGAYSKKFGTSVKSLQSDFRKHAKDLKAAAQKMREEGIQNMAHKIKGQIRENKEAVSHMADNVKFFQSEVSKKKKDYQAYARGPFRSSIKAFWG